jgi:hypothetical protein
LGIPECRTCGFLLRPEQMLRQMEEVEEEPVTVAYIQEG